MPAVNKPTPAPPVVPPDPPKELPQIPPDLHDPVILPTDPPVELPAPVGGPLMGLLTRIADSLDRLALATLAGGVVAQHPNHDAVSAASVAKKLHAHLSE